ncbi:oxidoreductase [Jatrophihabitans sp.]|jgi:NAD(P)-dependent dehydrogenase (short-subunit alcohol dehydrogenase family)|uniref:oxidoreductase n=1 Tax=Jatrophihabitans sp. TaxID=1932789 RepID=UPI0038CD96A4
MSWNASQLPSFAGRTALVTGANSGIGWQTALELARHGARVRLASRDAGRGEAAARRIREQAPGADIEPVRLDLASLASIKDVAEGWEGPLHLLVNNAGVMAPPSLRQTSDGFELQFGTNHLGHFALTGRLLPALLSAGGSGGVARVVTVSSLLHRGGQPGRLRGEPEPGYSPQRAYADSKLANVLFALELQRRAEAHAAPLTSTAAHPGVSRTNLMLNPDGMGAKPLARVVRNTVGQLMFQSAAAGAQPTLYAASVAAPGSYSGPQWPGGMRGPAGPAQPSRTAQDPQLAAQLWDLSEELTGVRYQWAASRP